MARTKKKVAVSRDAKTDAVRGAQMAALKELTGPDVPKLPRKSKDVSRHIAKKLLKELMYCIAGDGTNGSAENPHGVIRHIFEDLCSEGQLEHLESLLPKIVAVYLDAAWDEDNRVERLQGLIRVLHTK